MQTSSYLTLSVLFVLWFALMTVRVCAISFALCSQKERHNAFQCSEPPPALMNTPEGGPPHLVQPDGTPQSGDSGAGWLNLKVYLALSFPADTAKKRSWLYL